MLYIKFKIQDAEKFNDFKKLYNHLVDVRQNGFELDAEELEFDWDNMTDSEMQDAFNKMYDSVDPEIQEKDRYKLHIPDYVNSCFESYLKVDNENLCNLGVSGVLSIFNYLEFGFEVDFNNIDVLNDNNGIVEFSTSNFPFGGLDRFFITLKGFNVIPTECFDGFSVNQINWNSDFNYDFIELKSETENYIKKLKN